MLILWTLSKLIIRHLYEVLLKHFRDIMASFWEILWVSREILSLKMLSMLSMSSSLK